MNEKLTGNYRYRVLTIVFVDYVVLELETESGKWIDAKPNHLMNKDSFAPTVDS